MSGSNDAYAPFQVFEVGVDLEVQRGVEQLAEPAKAFLLGRNPAAGTSGRSIRLARGMKCSRFGWSRLANTAADFVVGRCFDVQGKRIEFGHQFQIGNAHEEFADKWKGLQIRRVEC